MTWRSNPRAWTVIPIILMAFLSPASAKVIYVDANAPGPAHDGSSWTNAYQYLQDALTEANSNPDVNEIRVAQGTYKPDQTSADPNGSGDRTATFQLISGILLYGGFPPGGGDLEMRDPNVYETILSGESNNAYHVVTAIECDGPAVLDGFTISGGNASRKTFPHSWGGGMYVYEADPIINNCVFRGNSAVQGGGLFIYSGGPRLTNCAFIGNHAEYSGGMANGSINTTLKNCLFIDNFAAISGGATICNDATMNYCTFIHNYAVYEGGAIKNDCAHPVLNHCIFVENYAPNGSATSNYEGDFTVTHCIFLRNSLDGDLGIWEEDARSVYSHCIIRENHIHLEPDSSTLNHSNIEGGWPGVGNIDVEPCFVDPNNGDYHLKSQAGRWDPNSKSWVKDDVTSPCIDAGNPGCPVGDEPSPNGNRRNMGAYGGTAEASKSPGNGRNIADLTNDWAVDSNDLKVFVDYWLQTGKCIPGDFDRSKFVDFNDYGIFASQWSHKQDSVAIFIDSNTHSNLTSQIQRLKSDIINDLGVNVFIFSDNWDDIREIKDILIDKYNNDGLIGAILIGDIPTAYFEYQNSGSVPTDRYFQDLSDKFIDVDGDGKFEREYYMLETDVMMREIWTGRIKPPVGRSEGMVLLRDYLDRNHNYRTGNLAYDKKMLYYGSVSINQDGMSQDDYNDLVNQIDDYTGLYESDDDVDSIYDPNLEMQKRIYLTALKNSYDFVFVNIHGTPIHQWLGENSPTDQCVVYHYEIKEFRPQPFFSVLASCSNGDFTTENYFAGWFLFSGNSLVVQSNTTVSYLTGANTVQFLKDYIPLKLGVTFGDMDKNDRNFIVSHILGDPTLTLRPKPTGDLPSLSRYESEIDFGDTERGTIPRQYISLWNGGTATLTISYKKAPFSINGEFVNLGYWDVFYYEPSTTGETFRDFEVRPGKCKVVPFYFYPRADGPIGRYSMTILFQTNDPENPYLEIHLSGNAI